jgi:hypothetical protein
MFVAQASAPVAVPANEVLRWTGMVLMAALAACSPALDWREATVDGPGLAAMFPCRPIGQSRELPLAGATVSMRLLACETDGRTFAIGVADVKDPAAVATAMTALRDASLGKLSNPPDPASAAVVGWAVDGATPQSAAGRWQVNSQRPDGAPLSLDTALLARGTWVIQATVIGGRADPNASAPFFDGLRFLR